MPEAIKASDEFNEYLALRHNAKHLLAGDAKGPERAPCFCKGDRRALTRRLKFGPTRL